jgi:ABC-2 type transport system ATP-binding protein
LTDPTTTRTQPGSSGGAAPRVLDIEVRGVGKIFRPAAGIRELVRGQLRRPPVAALSDVSFELAAGEIVCLMGPNGAGKSTLLRILAGLLEASTGNVRVAGLDVHVHSTEFRRKVSFVIGDERSFHWPLSGLHNLEFFGALHGLSAPESRRRAHALLARVGLAEAANRPFRTYSRGMRQRLALARGLMGDARVLLLDEPTLGLDPEGARDLRQFLRDDVLHAGGRTALVGTNDPTEARALADRVLRIRQGRLVGEMDPARIEAELGL